LFKLSSLVFKKKKKAEGIEDRERNEYFFFLLTSLACMNGLKKMRRAFL
jgi:hypothetical protein